MNRRNRAIARTRGAPVAFREQRLPSGSPIAVVFALFFAPRCHPRPSRQATARAIFADARGTTGTVSHRDVSQACRELVRVESEGPTRLISKPNLSGCPTLRWLVSGPRSSCASGPSVARTSACPARRMVARQRPTLARVAARGCVDGRVAPESPRRTDRLYHTRKAARSRAALTSS